MTFREKLQKEHPESINPDAAGGCNDCPSHFGYDSVSNEEKNCKSNGGYGCECCWDREIPEESESKKYAEIGKKLAQGYADSVTYDAEKKADEPHVKPPVRTGDYIPDPTPRILDSGHRREFETGAVRDICEGKGRCDLLPLDVVSEYYDFTNKSFPDKKCPEARVFRDIHHFQESGNWRYLYEVLAINHIFGDSDTLFLEVAKHFEEGCKKYGDNNWQKGIPTHCYVDSAVRHYLKYLRGDKDEPHDRAFCWNILCCIWTCIHKPELNDYAKKEVDE